MLKSISKISFGFLVAVLMTALSFAQAPGMAADDQDELVVVQNYADHVFRSYSIVLSETEKMRGLIQAFLRAPSEETFAAAKVQWTETRKLYSRTEVFRFYGGPIDNENGPEGAINAWPLDEGYIDSVLGADKSGIINNPAAYPNITGDLLRDLNEKDGEKNISTGWHAIEFLLWGQDFNENGPGERPFTDYVVGGRAKNPERRAQYLNVVTDLLVEDLASLKTAWDPSIADSYYNNFVAPEKVKESLGFLLTGAVRLASFELSQERMNVAYDTQLQEDEHSCFSDTTHNDILYNFLGIKDVVLGTGSNTASLMSLLQKRFPQTASLLAQSLTDTESKMRAIPAPFDQAIYSDEGRAAILAGIESLEKLGAELEQVSTDLGLDLAPAE